MAMWDDLLKGNPVMAIGMGLCAVLLAPMAGQVLRPAAKAVIKGGILAYQGLAELGEMTIRSNGSRRALASNLRSNATF